MAIDHIVKKILEKEDIERWCCGCHTTTKQKYKTKYKKLPDDIVPYQCQKCGSVREYIIKINEDKS